MEQKIKDIFESLDLGKEIFNEDTMKQVALVIEAKVNEAKEEMAEELQLEYEARYEVDKENLVDRLDEYMNYFVENFVEENQESVVDAVKVKTAERILEKMDGFVNDFNLSLSEDNLEYEDDVEELRADLNDTINENIELKTMLEEAAKNKIIEETAFDIEFDSDRDSFVQLAENLEFEDVDSFKYNLGLLSEKLLPTTRTRAPKIDNHEYAAAYLEEAEITSNYDMVLEETTEQEVSVDAAIMNQYLKFVEK